MSSDLNPYTNTGVADSSGITTQPPKLDLPDINETLLKNAGSAPGGIENQQGDGYLPSGGLDTKTQSQDKLPQQKADAGTLARESEVALGGV